MNTADCGPMAHGVANGFLGAQVPKNGRTLRSRGEFVAIPAEGQVIDRALMNQAHQKASLGHPPNVRYSVVRGRGEELATAAECHRIDGPALPEKGRRRLGRGEVPETHRPVAESRRGDISAIRTEHGAANGADMSECFVDGLPVMGIPNLGCVAGPGEDPRVFRTELD